MVQLPNEIWLEGEMYSGKDFIGAILVAEGYTRIALADALKAEVALFHHITVEELEANKGKYRKELQDYGMLRREQDENYWITRWRHLREQIAGPVVVTDCRYENEALTAIERGAFVVKVKTPPQVRAQRMRDKLGYVDKNALTHPSETGIKKLPCHCEIPGTLEPINIIPMLETGYSALMRLRGRVMVTADQKRLGR